MKSLADLGCNRLYRLVIPPEYRISTAADAAKEATMSAAAPEYGWFAEKMLAHMAAELEYLSWAPEPFWLARDPGIVEYNSWGSPPKLTPPAVQV